MSVVEAVHGIGEVHTVCIGSRDGNVEDMQAISFPHVLPSSKWAQRGEQLMFFHGVISHDPVLAPRLTTESSGPIVVAVVAVVPAILGQSTGRHRAIPWPGFEGCESRSLEVIAARVQPGKVTETTDLRHLLSPYTASPETVSFSQQGSDPVLELMSFFCTLCLQDCSLR